MSTPGKIDPARGWMFVEKLLAEEEAERIEGLSEDEFVAELEREGIDPSSAPSAEVLLEKASMRAARQDRPLPPEPVETPANAAPERAPTAKAVTHDVPAPKGVVVPIRRSQGLVWGTAAAFAAALAGVFAITEPAFVSSFHRPTPREKAESMRDEAIGSCARGSLLTCRQLLDDAQRLDPGGESEERVHKAREAIEKGVYPGPIVPEGPGR